MMKHLNNLAPLLLPALSALSALPPERGDAFAFAFSVAPRARRDLKHVDSLYSTVGGTSRTSTTGSTALLVAKDPMVSPELETEAAATTSSSSSSSSSATTYSSMTTLPRHPSNELANELLIQTEAALRSMQEKGLLSYDADDEDIVSVISRGSSDSRSRNSSRTTMSTSSDNLINSDLQTSLQEQLQQQLEIDLESVYANAYVDLGKVDTVGFDYDYTLVTYTEELLELIYDMALKRLVEEKEYPREMLESGLKFDPFFSIRGE